MQFVLAFWLFTILCVVGFEDKFAGRFSFDDIVYTSIDVPQATKTLNLGFWAQGFGTEQVKVLLGKGRIPSIGDYDELLDIPSLSQSLQLLQSNPTSGKLFIGFWGGKMLRSYRYFAGERPTSGAGIQYSLVSNEDDGGTTASTVIGDGFVERTSLLTINSARSDVVIVLPDRQALQVNFSASMMNSSCPMTKPAGDILFVLEAYYDIAAEAATSSPKFVTAVQRVIKARLCDVQFMANLAPLVLNIPFPIAGRWTIVSSILEVDPYASARRLSTTHSSRQVLRIVDYDALFQHDDAVIDRSAPPPPSPLPAQPQTAAYDDRSVLNGRLRWTAPAAQSAARSMNVFSLSASHQEYIGSSSNVFPRSSANSPDTSTSNSNSNSNSGSAEGRWIASPIVVADVPSSPGLWTANIFGGVVVQLFLRVNSHSEYFLALVEALPWMMALRVGNAPYATFDTEGTPQWVADATLFTVGVPSTATAATAAEGFPPPKGGTRPVTSVSQRASYPSKSNARQHVLRFDWFWPRPLLDHFHTRGDIMDSSRRIYFRVGLQYPSGTAYDRVVESIVQELQDNAITIDVQMKMVADPCEALGPRPCAHGGTCVASSAGTLGLSSTASSNAVTASLGDAVITAQCRCRYPWAGAACRDLAVPSDVYAWQVIVLVVTNAAMWPAIALSLHYELYLITVGLTASSLSSAVYHLCDTEVYCLAGVSFEAWHVLDVLFSVAMIATVVLFLAPISRSLHAACSVAVLSLILAPVIDDPTNAAVLGLTVFLSIAATLLLWVTHLRRLTPPTSSSSSSLLPSSTAAVDGGPSYASVPMFSDESTRSTEDSDDATTTMTMSSDDRGDIEMEALSSGSSGSTSVNPLHRTAADGGSDPIPSMTTATVRLRPETAPLSVTALLHESLDLVIAAGIGTVGLSSYALDNRTNYWYVHSLWHMCMMTAAFFLLRGRMRIFKRFDIDDR